MDFAYSPRVEDIAPAACAISWTNMCFRGAMGLSQDLPLANRWTLGRALRLADWPEEVHLQSIARLEIKQARGQDGRTRFYFTPPERTRGGIS